jgi:uncharacterized protein YlxW (UPF0749 family)
MTESVIFLATTYLCFAGSSLTAVFSTSGVVSQKESIIKERQRSVRHLKEALKRIQGQVEAHETGTKKVEEDRYMSQLQRAQSYKAQLYDASVPLTDEVR